MQRGGARATGATGANGGALRPAHEGIALNTASAGVRRPGLNGRGDYRVGRFESLIPRRLELVAGHNGPAMPE